MKRLLTFVFFISTLSVTAQVDSVFRFEREFNYEIVDFSVDNLGNIYILSRNGQLKKLDANGDSVAVFNAVRGYGQLYSIDVTNPLKILLYYKDFGTVLSLDRFLSVRNSLDLRKQNMFQVKAVGLAYDNNIWVFDEQDGKLKKISEEGKVVDQTNDFRLLFDSLPSPEFINDQDGLVYLYDPAKGVYIFDYYGSLKNNLPLKGWRDFTVASKSLYGRMGKGLMKYQPGTLDLQEVTMPSAFQNATRIRITQQKIYILLGGRLQVYSIRSTP